jgi:hypothetical protein
LAKKIALRCSLVFLAQSSAVLPTLSFSPTLAAALASIFAGEARACLQNSAVNWQFAGSRVLASLNALASILRAHATWKKGN